MFKLKDSEQSKQNVNNFDKYDDYYYQYENKVKLSNTSNSEKYTNIIKQQYQSDKKCIVITK
jgi:hypothetical protein